MIDALLGLCALLICALLWLLNWAVPAALLLLEFHRIRDVVGPKEAAEWLAAHRHVRRERWPWLETNNPLRDPD